MYEINDLFYGDKAVTGPSGPVPGLFNFLTPQECERFVAEILASDDVCDWWEE